MTQGRPVVDLVGKRFGRLVGIRFHHQGKGGSTYFEFQCDCGNRKVLCGTEVSRAKTKSCGCWRSEYMSKSRKKFPDGVAAGHNLYVVYRGNARSRGLEFSITEEEFLMKTKEACTYCGIEPAQKWFGTAKNLTPYTYNGLDRVDNSKGYTIDNICPCCKPCNMAKHSMSLPQFQQWIARLVKFNSLKVRDYPGEQSKLSEKEQSCLTM